MPDTGDERCAGANIFASARNTVCVHRRLKRTDIPSYHRWHRQQMHSRARRHAFVDASALSTFTDASSNVRTYAQQCADVYVSVNMSANESVCVHRHIQGNALVCTSLLCCLCRFLLFSPANGGRLMARRDGRGEDVAVTPVPRTSSGPIQP